jgi:hypothetical protein
MALVLGLLCLLNSLALLLAQYEAVVFVVDPSWDCVESYVAHEPLLQKYKIVKVWTHLGTAPSCNSGHADIYRTFTFNSLTPNDSAAAEQYCSQLRSLDVTVKAVIPTHDPTVYLTDQLAACLGVRGNPSVGPLAKARRDKWVMGEAVRKAGIRAIQEKVVSSWSEAKEHLQSLNPPLSLTNPVIFKILEGSSSEGLNKVYSLEQAEEVFRHDTSGTEVSSIVSTGITKVLIQEFLQGAEYVIDSASRDGVHKVVTVWTEDLHPGNGVIDLYYGFKVMDPKDEKIQVIIDYANKVLDATGLKNGASDMEVIWSNGGPCVVDLNGRWSALMWHDGLKMMEETVGNNQITATVNAYLDGDAFDEMPLVPLMKQHGAIVFTMARQTGFLRDIPGLAVAKKLPSYSSSFNQGMFVGTHIQKLPTSNPCLFILLTHREKAVVDADYDRIVGLENSDAWFDIRQSAGNTSLTALSSSVGVLPGNRLPEIAAVAMLAVVAVSALAAMSLQKARDGTEYLAIS